MYGVTKVCHEPYAITTIPAFGVDTRGVRLPGLISYAASGGVCQRLCSTHLL